MSYKRRRRVTIIITNFSLIPIKSLEGESVICIMDNSMRHGCLIKLNVDVWASTFFPHVTIFGILYIITPLTRTIWVSFDFDTIVIRSRNRKQAKTLYGFFEVNECLMVEPIGCLDKTTTPNTNPIILMFRRHTIIVELFIDTVCNIVGVYLLRLVSGISIRACPCAFRYAINPNLIGTSILPLSHIQHATLITKVVW